ncbi:hypothetical protein BB561_003503 [Smittium simulii]|uniref:Protein RER1 n=1 Tax=Smittium simulii TaxID=133385 RepID=A0A2T9YKZ3_9FUNG|nr:hypothetical protein BB561_003503 [Smittium simulii]
MMQEGSESSPATSSNILTKLNTSYQAFLDHSVPYVAVRWVSTVFLILFFIVRIFVIQGWYVVIYALGIYLLNLFLAFLSPKFDPEFAENMETDTQDDNGPGLLPINNDDEFRPFIRRLPEFKFWYHSTVATSISFFCTFFSAFDVPVFWPVLLFYWVFLFVLTMRRQISHMIKYKYVPFSNYGKKKYTQSS